MTTYATGSDALPPGRWVVARGGTLRYELDNPGDTTSKPLFCGTERGWNWHRFNDQFNWPLPPDDPCGCRAAHRAHEHFRTIMRRRERREAAA